MKVSLILVLVVSSLVGLGCTKPKKPPATVVDFAKRHHCPEGQVRSQEEGASRARVSGCGQSDVYVYECAGSSTHTATRPDPNEPSPEPEPNIARATSVPDQTGCAWTREKPDPGANWHP
jgi:hypothetical protein